MKKIIAAAIATMLIAGCSGQEEAEAPDMAPTDNDPIATADGEVSEEQQQELDDWNARMQADIDARVEEELNK
jgi:PBP1b-binding outer membrane lipoprotein LpoB